MLISYSFCANLLFILWFYLIFHCLKAGFVPCSGYKLMMVPDLTTRECEHYWWFLSILQENRSGGVILHSVIFPIFQNYQNISYPWNITLVFGRHRCSSAVETPDQYKHNSKYLTCIFAESKFTFTEKWTNRALVTTTPGLTWMRKAFNTLRLSQDGCHFPDIFNAFSCMKMYKFRFHWSLFSRVQLTILQHWFR